jgi:hypothetical protein
MTRLLIGAAALAVAASMAVPAAAQAPARTQAGTLNCDISAGLGLIIGSKRSVRCVFTPSRRGVREEIYMGSITRFGLDIGATAGGRMVWAVLAPTQRPWAPGSLAGSYGGASGEASVGAGVGANVLVGGSNRTVALQPVSVQGQAGLNLAVGVAGLELRSGAR